MPMHKKINHVDHFERFFATCSPSPLDKGDDQRPILSEITAYQSSEAKRKGRSAGPFGT